ncbi:MAG TPA: GIY-YIG nuclease family protein [Candidatus Saccharimonadales bacterium]|nr:GIY-YIG nuclease family protein [Candidatus Saccharimonadales bacterium]
MTIWGIGVRRGGARAVATATGHKMFYIYVLRSKKNNRFYTGSTDNLDRRLIEHNSGKSRYTRLTRPFELVYYEAFNSRAEARRKEKYFKTGRARDELKRIIDSE